MEPYPQFDLAALAALLGAPVQRLERLRWGFENRTELATLADGRRVVVQRITSRGMAAHKLRLARLLPGRLAEVGLRMPTLLHADAGAGEPLAVREYIPGQAGAAYMGEPEGAILVAQAMGALLPLLAQVRTEGVGLHTAWADPARLAAQATRQLERWRADLSTAHVALLEESIAALAPLFSGRPAVFAHGDFCPVNALLAEGEGAPGNNQQTANTDASLVLDRSPSAPGALSVVALLDVEFARVADALFDAAWWGWIVRFHHPERWRVAWPHLLAAAGILDTPDTATRVQVIQRLRCLEALDYNAGISAERGDEWAARLRTALDWP